VGISSSGKEAGRVLAAYGDFGRLNVVNVPDIYHLPNMIDFSARVTGCKFFFKD
jgi:hypothetical protein